MNNQLIAIVDGREIREQNLNILASRLGSQMSQFKGENGRKQLIDELITQELFYSDAIEKGLEKNPE